MRLIPNSWGSPRALREFNKCHNPAGPKGGQFCALDMYPGSRYSLPIPRYLHAAVLAARRAGIEVYLTQQPEPVKDITGNIMDPLAMSHLQPGEVTFRDDKGHTYTMPRGRITLVLRGGEYEPTYTPDFMDRPWEKKPKDLKPEDLKNPASRFDVISTLLHEIGHAVVRDPSRTDRAGEHVIHPAEIVAGERVTNAMAREVAAWQFAIAFMPKNLISARMVRDGLASHAYTMYHEQKVRAEDYFKKHVASYNADDYIEGRLRNDPKDPEIKAKADAFAAKALKVILRYGKKLRRTGAKLVPPSRPAPWYDLTKRVTPGPGGVGI